MMGVASRGLGLVQDLACLGLSGDLDAVVSWLPAGRYLTNPDMWVSLMWTRHRKRVDSVHEAGLGPGCL